MGKRAPAKREAPRRPAASTERIAPENETDASTFRDMVTFFQSPAGERWIIIEILILTAMTLLLYSLYKKELKRRENVLIAMGMIRAVIVERDPIYKGKDDFQILAAAQNLSEETWWYSKQNKQLQKEIDILNKNLDDGWISFSEALYFFSLELRSWMDAKKMCEKAGAKLAYIETDEEQLFINREVEGREKYFWIGLFRKNIDTWTWVSGMDAEKPSWNSYFNVPNGEPFHDCVVTTHECWAERCRMALKCAQQMPYICKKVPDDAWL